MSSLKTQLSVIDDDYLIGLSNKGLVNRAMKEIIDAEVTISLDDLALEATFADGTIVTIKDNINNFSCSCPARSICKHVIMALMLAAKDLSNNNIPSDINTGSQGLLKDKVCYDSLLEYTQEALIKKWSKRQYNNVLDKIANGQSVDINEDNKLMVFLKDDGITVSFLPGSSLDQALCSCKIKGCTHPLSALLHYIHYKTGVLNFIPASTDFIGDMSVIPLVINLVEEIYQCGLFRLSSEYGAKCSQYATLCHGAGFASLERLLERSAKQLDLYQSKNADFNINNLVRDLGRIYAICDRINKNHDASIVTERFKQQYRELPQIRIIGIGAYPWYAQSGFCGLTAVFYSPELSKFVTFSLSRNADSQKQAIELISHFWKNNSIWDLHTNFANLSRGEWHLTTAKLSESSRLSSSKSTKGSNIRTRTSLTGEDISKIVINDFTKLKELFCNDEGENGEIYAIIKPARIEDGHFDQITQEYKLPIYDKNDNCLQLTVPYSLLNENILYHCENITVNTNLRKSRRQPSGKSAAVSRFSRCVVDDDFRESYKKLSPEAISVRITIHTERYGILITPFAFWIKGKIISIGQGAKK